MKTHSLAHGRAGTTTYIFTYIRGAEGRNRAESRGILGWRRRESNPGPEVLPAGIYVRVRRTIVSLRVAPAGGLAPSLANLGFACAPVGGSRGLSCYFAPDGTHRRGRPVGRAAI